MKDSMLKKPFPKKIKFTIKEIYIKRFAVGRFQEVKDIPWSIRDYLHYKYRRSKNKSSKLTNKQFENLFSICHNNSWIRSGFTRVSISNRSTLTLNQRCRHLYTCKILDYTNKRDCSILSKNLTVKHARL